MLCWYFEICILWWTTIIVKTRLTICLGDLVLPSDCPARLGCTSRHIELRGRSLITFVMKFWKNDSFAAVKMPTVGAFRIRTTAWSSDEEPCSWIFSRIHARTLGMSTASASDVFEANIVKLSSRKPRMESHARWWHSWLSNKTIASYFQQWFLQTNIEWSILFDWFLFPPSSSCFTSLARVFSPSFWALSWAPHHPNKNCEIKFRVIVWLQFDIFRFHDMYGICQPMNKLAPRPNQLAFKKLPAPPGKSCRWWQRKRGAAAGGGCWVVGGC